MPPPRPEVSRPASDFWRLAGVEGLEPPTPGFGDRCSSQLSYTPMRTADDSVSLASPPSSVRSRASLDDLRDHAGTHRAAAPADGEPQLLLHRDRHDQLHHHRHVVARHHHLGALRKMHHAGHVRRPEIKLRPVVGEKRRVPAPLLLGQDVGLRLELGVRLHRPGLAQHLTALHLLALGAAQQAAHVVPRLALVEQLAEPLHPGPRGLLRGLQPHDLTSSPTLITPRSIRPVTTVPRPEIENTSSTGIRNGWSFGRSGCGIYVSHA